MFDDRESVLHVLTYAGLRYLKHDATPGKLTALLDVYDVYISNLGRPDTGTPAKRSYMQTVEIGKVHFKVADFSRLLRELCRVFAARYPGDDSEDEDPRTTARRAQLEDPLWLYSTLEKFADKLPARGPKEIDWIDNSTVTFTDRTKRKAGDEGSVSVQLLKKFKAFDGNATPPVTSDI